MAKATGWTIKTFPATGPDRVYVGTGKKNKEAKLREACMQMCVTSGEVHVTEDNAKAWQVWDCAYGAKFATRGRVIYKDPARA